ncbi:forkhead box protein I2-like [Dendrobates tinctorius]|uniref:forkhead box protein I2-like n=1 Tax=Dendrobates tinctorius TaxID=92724 RepID=UPI003CCA6824
MDDFGKYTARTQLELTSTQDLENLEFDSLSDYTEPNVSQEQWLGDSMNPPCLDGNGFKNLPSGNANNQVQVLTPSDELRMVEEPYLPHLNYTDLLQTVKPPYSFLDLIMMALENAPEQKLTSRQIFTYVVERFPFYRMDQAGWQNSIRHTLSVNNCSKKVARDKCVKGLGCYWTLDQSCVKMLNNGKLKGQRKKYDYDCNRYKKLDDKNNVQSPNSSPTLDADSCLSAAINALLNDGMSTNLEEDVSPTIQYYTES